MRENTFHFYPDTGDLPPNPFTFNSTRTINGLMAPCMLCSEFEGQWVYFSFLSSRVLWRLLWEQSLAKHSCLQSESSQNTDAAQILSFHWVNTEDYCKVWYPFSTSTLLGMRKATATHAGGSNFFLNKGYFRVKDNCIERESRGKKWFWKNVTLSSAFYSRYHQ